MNIHTQKFITLSELFEGQDKVYQIWSEHDHSDFTWGSNNRSMINIHTMLRSLDSLGIYDSEADEEEPNGDEEEPSEEAFELREIYKRLYSIPDAKNVMIDLEN